MTLHEPHTNFATREDNRILAHKRRGESRGGTQRLYKVESYSSKNARYQESQAESQIEAHAEAGGRCCSRKRETRRPVRTKAGIRRRAMSRRRIRSLGRGPGGIHGASGTSAGKS